MEKRGFNLSGWQWRKYKTRDGRDAKIVYANKENICVEIGTKLFYTFDLNGSVIIGGEVAEQLLDVPDQKEPEWFIDNRKGLHCCFCHEDRSLYQSINLFNHPSIKHIVCETCLKHLKSIIRKEGRWD